MLSGIAAVGKAAFLRQVPTKQIDDAIGFFRSSGHRAVQMYLYKPVPINEPIKPDSTAVETEAFTLSELYREMAYRIETGTQMLRDTLKEFEDPNE